MHRGANHFCARSRESLSTTTFDSDGGVAIVTLSASDVAEQTLGVLRDFFNLFVVFVVVFQVVVFAGNARTKPSPAQHSDC